MNKAITDGLVLMPPPFANGLNVWSSGDGTPGSATYDGAANAAFVPADQDFGGCLELLKTDATQKLRYMGETPIQPGLYLRITARVKVVSGNLPTVRIAAWAGGAGGVQVTGLVTTGPEVALAAYGTIYTVSAIVGTGSRGGVNMPWGLTPLYGHFGLDLTGPNGGVVRIDDIEIEDITSAFLRTMMDWVDVRDYGAVGDGVTDNRAAFEAADDAAAGREVLVPAGNYYVASSLTLDSEVRFEGKLTMPTAARLTLTKNFTLPAYIDAFGGDEMQGLRKGLQALFNFSDHDSLDMGGRRIEITEPIDVKAAVDNVSSYSNRRVLRNGQLDLIAGPAWDNEVATSQASYSTANQNQLTGVVNVANIPVGSLVTGVGVGREVYVTSKNVAAGTVNLSDPLYGAAGTQVYTFTRFKYALDFSGFSSLSKFVLQEVELLCNGVGSAVLLAPAGSIFQLNDCHVIRPKDRGITSHGTGCQGLHVDRCQFISNENSVPAIDRVSIAFNVNANDSKIRDNRMARFRHTGVFSGSGHLIVGNHWFQGDDGTDTPRLGGMVFTKPHLKSVITGNYIDNSFVEWTNEHDSVPGFISGFTFGALTITGNIFTVNDAASWFSWIVIKPYGPNHYLSGFSVTGNTFRSINGQTDRVERIDSSFATLDISKSRNVVFQSNTFNNTVADTFNPVTLSYSQSTAQTVWNIDFAPYLPFGGRVRTVEGFVAEGAITNASNQRLTEMPFVTLEQGTNGSEARLNFNAAAKGKVRITARMDQPI